MSDCDTVNWSRRPSKGQLSEIRASALIENWPLPVRVNEFNRDLTPIDAIHYSVAARVTSGYADNPSTKHRVVGTVSKTARCVNPVKYLPHENYVYGQVAEESEEGRMDLCGLA